MRILAWACLLLLATNMRPDQIDNKAFFPPRVQGWTLAAADETYTPETLYQYIDGASELYISYGFTRLDTRRYEKAGQPEIVVDWFDMGAAANAFGIFAHSQENPDKQVGQDSEYLDGLLRFWKGRFYVSLLCSPETPASRPAVMELGRKLAQGIKETGSPPAVLALLPEAGLLPATIRAFHHPAWQNTYVFIAAENILEIGPGCEAVLAKYEQGKERPVVFLVLYPEAAAAQRAYAALRGKFLLPADEGQAARLADGKYLAAGLEKRVVAAVWHGGGAAPALRLLSELRTKISELDK